MIYAIGDVHGQYDKLCRLLAKLDDAGIHSDDRIVFMGDYVDRGPDTSRVVETLVRLAAARPNTIFLRGNHEQMMLDARERFDSTFDADNSCGNTESGRYWFVEGGQETLNSYGPPEGRRWFELVPDEHWDFIRATKMEYEEGGYLFVHAGVVPAGRTWFMDGFKADPRLWIRYEFIASESEFDGRIVVFGHTPTRDGLPMIQRNKLAIDTGAGFGAPLTAVLLPQPYEPGKVVVFQAD